MLQPSQRQRILQLNFSNKQLFFAIVPTWKLNPENSSNILASDFALGCLHYIAGFDLEYTLVEEYKAGFKAIAKLINLNEANELSQYSLN